MCMLYNSAFDVECTAICVLIDYLEYILNIYEFFTKLSGYFFQYPGGKICFYKTS